MSILMTVQCIITSRACAQDHQRFSATFTSSLTSSMNSASTVVNDRNLAARDGKTIAGDGGFIVPKYRNIGWHPIGVSCSRLSVHSRIRYWIDREHLQKKGAIVLCKQLLLISFGAKFIGKMSRFEKICWETSTIQMKVNGSINIPELSSPISPSFAPDCEPITSQPTQADDDLAGPFSPTLSIDSGRSTSDVLSPSPKYLLHGGPGFSLGLLDSTSGTTKHIPVPFPSLSPSLSRINFEDFSFSEVLSGAFAGDAQVWVGTGSGTLHVFDLTHEPRLSSHAFTKFSDPVSCIATRQPSVVDESLPVINGSAVRGVKTKTEVLVGTSNGNLTILTGEANERGGLRNPLKCPRKVIQLGGFEEGGNFCIKSITMVVCSGMETYWCACGASIVVVRRSDWREMVRLDGCAGLPLLSDELSREIHISQLLATEFGVWSATSHSSTVLLWDTINFSTKMKITCQ